MPKETKIESSVSAFYKRNAIDLWMFGFVEGFREAIPHASIKQSICAFIVKYNLSEDDYPYEAAVRTFTRIRESFIWKDSK